MNEALAGFLYGGLPMVVIMLLMYRIFWNSPTDRKIEKINRAAARAIEADNREAAEVKQQMVKTVRLYQALP